MHDLAGNNDFRGWVPVKLLAENEELQCRWLYVGDKAFTEPFFDETIAASRLLPENGFLNKRISDINVLAGLAKEAAIEPTAFIFHISRCGSTLISQMLGLQPSNIVLSEVPFFDELLRYGKKHDRMPAILLQLKNAIALYAAKRKENEQHLFIKTDSWHIHFYKELRALYPHTPFFLLYRKPGEVIRSQKKKRGMHALPNFLDPAIFGFDAEKIASMQFDEYTGMVVETYLEAFAAILQEDRLAYALNYHDGALQIINTVALVTGMQISEAERALMQKRAGFHAKFPGQVFSEENPAEAVPGFLKRSVELYEQVEAIRLSTNRSS